MSELELCAATLLLDAKRVLSILRKRNELVDPYCAGLRDLGSAGYCLVADQVLATFHPKQALSEELIAPVEHTTL